MTDLDYSLWKYSEDDPGLEKDPVTQIWGERNESDFGLQAQFHAPPLAEDTNYLVDSRKDEVYTQEELDTGVMAEIDEEDPEFVDAEISDFADSEYLIASD